MRKHYAEFRTSTGEECCAHARGTSQGFECSAVIAGYLVTRQYIGYTMREALAEFVSEFVKGGE